MGAPVITKTTAWIFPLLLVLMAACTPNERPSLFESLSSTEAALTAGTETLAEAIELGTVDVGSKEYAKVYEALAQANALMDSAWSAYRAGALGESDQLRSFALQTYREIRPLLYQLAGEPK